MQFHIWDFDYQKVYAFFEILQETESCDVMSSFQKQTGEIHKGYLFFNEIDLIESNKFWNDVKYIIGICFFSFVICLFFWVGGGEIADFY